MNNAAHVLALLVDGNWHTFGEILNAVGDTVTSEKASQTYASSGKPKVTADLDYKVRMGRRRIVQRVLGSLIFSKRIERKGEGFQSEYRKSVTEADPFDQLMRDVNFFEDQINDWLLNHMKAPKVEHEDFLFHFRALKRMLKR
jgi:hypothetical protein